MPYYTEEEFEKVVDIDGRKIKVGDILEDVVDKNPDNPWRYFYCYRFGDEIEIRDLNAHNVCMCETGINGNVRVLGNYRDFWDKLGLHGLTEENIDCYFGAKSPYPEPEE